MLESRKEWRIEEEMERWRDTKEVKEDEQGKEDSNKQVSGGKNGTGVWTKGKRFVGKKLDWLQSEVEVWLENDLHLLRKTTRKL